MHKKPFGFVHYHLKNINTKFSPLFTVLLILPSFLLGIAVDAKLNLDDLISVDAPTDLISRGVQKITTGASTRLDTLSYTVDTKAQNKVGDLYTESFYSELPVGKVESFITPNANGTAIFIPQFHKLPGSETLDKQNDRAVTTQNQILSIEEKLISEGVDLLMVEGELAGDISPEKNRILEEKISTMVSLTSIESKLKQSLTKSPIVPTLDKSVLEQTEKLILNLDREITLKGSPYTLWNKYPEIKLVGAENQPTLNESANLVREHIYLNDRISQLSSKSESAVTLSSSSRTGTLLSISEYQKIISLLSKKSSLIVDVKKLISEAEKVDNNENSLLLGSLLKELENLELLNNKEKTSTNTVTTAEYNNPYARTSDVSILKRKLAENETNIDEVVVNKRNKETAIFFKQAIERHSTHVGIIQYGAGHKEGLIKELQENGLNVVVITPEEVYAAKDL